jgi:hypothetical protein
MCFGGKPKKKEEPKVTKTQTPTKVEPQETVETYDGITAPDRRAESFVKENSWYNEKSSTSSSNEARKVTVSASRMSQRMKVKSLKQADEPLVI